MLWRWLGSFCQIEVSRIIRKIFLFQIILVTIFTRAIALGSSAPLWSVGFLWAHFGVVTKWARQNYTEAKCCWTSFTLREEVNGFWCLIICFGIDRSHVSNFIDPNIQKPAQKRNAFFKRAAVLNQLITIPTAAIKKTIKLFEFNQTRKASKTTLIWGRLVWTYRAIHFEVSLKCIWAQKMRLSLHSGTMNILVRDNNLCRIHKIKKIIQIRAIEKVWSNWSIKNWQLYRRT